MSWSQASRRGEWGQPVAPLAGLAATCSRGLEEILARELVALGATALEGGRGVVRFAGDANVMLRANMHLRTALRVLLDLGSGPVGGREDLYRFAAEVPWEQWLAPSMTFAVTAVGRHPAFVNTAFAALVVKDAVADRLRSRLGSRPDVARLNPDVSIHVHVSPGAAELALDSSGEPLSHRGYRPRGGPAPLAETSAAGLLLLAGYDGSQPFIDPMCGTGTIAIEAALIATGRAPGLGRRFACEHWPRHDFAIARRVRAEAQAAIHLASAGVGAADHDPRAVAATRANATAAGVGALVLAECRGIRDLPVQPAGTVLVVNPPYGQRLGSECDLPALYREIGDACKRALGAGGSAWVLTGEKELGKQIGLRASRRIVVYNGPIECRLLGFEIVAGSWRDRRRPDGPLPDDRLCDS